MNFNDLVYSIKTINESLKIQAGKAVNISLTVRNWLIGCYIAEYELKGADRANYGENVLQEISKSLKDVSNCGQRQLNKYIRFYKIYHQIWGTLSPKSFLLQLISEEAIQKRIWGTLSPKFNADQSDGTQTASTLSLKADERLFELLSYSHLEKLVELEDETKRLFYQVECMRGGWSVRELKRQIGSLYYERSGLSLNKEKLADMAQKDAEKIVDPISVRDPYVFEFLGLKPKEVMSESQLEDQLMEKLEDFILELGNGFCFEAKQKRILIGDTHYFIDLVFYHRILKCHVLIELKVEEFSQENIGQLNTYVSWYKKNVMLENDNPPVGILLCTGKDESLVEYALAGMDNNLFVSKYMLELPKKEEMREFIEQQMRELLGQI